MTKNDSTISQKMAQLDEAVQWFESEDFELEQASEKLKVAAKLAGDIEKALDSVENDIRQVKQSFANES